MEPLTYETYTRNPELVAALLEQARRERARAIQHFVVDPIKRLFSSHAARPDLGTSRKAGGAAA